MLTCCAAFGPHLLRGLWFPPAARPLVLTCCAAFGSHLLRGLWFPPAARPLVLTCCAAFGPHLLRGLWFPPAARPLVLTCCAALVPTCCTAFGAHLLRGQRLKRRLSAPPGKGWSPILDPDLGRARLRLLQRMFAPSTQHDACDVCIHVCA